MTQPKKSPRAVTSGSTYNTVAIAAFVVSFFVPPVGLILAIVALYQIAGRKQAGKALAIAAIIVSSILMVFVAIIMSLLTQAVRNNVQIGAYNAERKTDINALSNMLEHYHDKAGGYPSLTDLNSAAWRAAAPVQVDGRAYCDPSANSSTKSAKDCDLAATPTAGKYTYQTWDADGTTPCTAKAGELCTRYTLTATLEKQTYQTSTVYSKSSYDGD